MINKLTMTIFLALFLSYDLWAEDYIAEAVIVRGEVTVLELGELQAKKVKKGTRFKKDASILTGKRSFIRVQYLDKSTVSLGPKGKMVINIIKKKGVGLVSLIKGKLRSKVIKKNKKITKDKSSNLLYIKTKTASLGVRGTDFQVIYNKKNNGTSLLTYEGEVQISKNKKSENTLDYKNKTDSEILLDQEQKMESLLRSKESSTVPKGQFSGVTPKLKKTSLPVKISPQQFTLLYKNDELKEASELKKTVSDKLLAQADQKAPLEGVSNLKTGDYAPRAGGFLDLETGLYVAPSSKSKLNKELGVFEDKNIGKLSLKTGDYIPPKGLKLDAEKGFVPDEEILDPKESLEREEKIRELNQDLQVQKEIKSRPIPIKKEVSTKKRVKTDLLHPNLSPKKGSYIFKSNVTVVSYSEKSDKGNNKDYDLTINGLQIALGIEYGLTPKVSMGIQSHVGTSLSSKLSFGTASMFNGKNIDLTFMTGIEAPTMSLRYNRPHDYFWTSFRPKLKNGKAVIIDVSGKSLQKADLIEGREQFIMGYKKTWNRLDKFYSVLFQLEYLGQQIKEVDDLNYHHVIEGSKISYRTSFEGQMDISERMALRGEVGLNMIEKANYRNGWGGSHMVDPELVIDQKLSLHYQRKRNLFGLSISRSPISFTYDGNDTITKTNLLLGLEYTTGISF